MSRPEHLGVPNTAEGIRCINEAQDRYDRDPEAYERQERDAEEVRQQEQEEMARWRESEEERIQAKLTSDLPF